MWLTIEELEAINSALGECLSVCDGFDDEETQRFISSAASAQKKIAGEISRKQNLNRGEP